MFFFQITETYAFLPREAVTRFLLGCTECQKHPRSPSPISVLPTPSPSPTLPVVIHTTPPQLPMTPLPTPEINFIETNGDHKVKNLSSPTGSTTYSNNFAEDVNVDIEDSPIKVEEPLRVSSPEPKRSSNPLDVCNLTSRDPPKPRTPAPKLWSPVETIEREEQKKKMMMGGNIDFSLPITTTYLKYMRSLGCTDEDAMKLENRQVSVVIEHLMHELVSHYFY